MEILNLTFPTSTAALLDATDQNFETNVSLLPNSDVSHSVPDSGWLFLAVELSLIVIILIGNSLTIAAICTTPSLQTITNRSVDKDTGERNAFNKDSGFQFLQSILS